MISKRKIGYSILFSILLPGLGQIYNGQLIKGVVILFLWNVILTILEYAGLLNSFLGLVAYLLLIVTIFGYTIIDSVIVAKNSKEYQIQWFNRSYIYVSLIILIFTTRYFTSDYSPLHSYKRFYAVSPNMYPTILVNDNMIVNMDYYNNNQIGLGDVVVYKVPYDSNIFYIGRVAGLPTNQIDLIENELIINGKKHVGKHVKDGMVANEYPTRIFQSQLGERDYYYATFKEEMEFGINEDYHMEEPIGDQNVFILGDSRSDSYDSRSFGTINIRDIVGRPLYYIWSDQTDKIGMDINKLPSLPSQIPTSQ